MIPLFKVRMAEEAAAATAAVLASGYIGQGPKCEEFERQFGELVGAPEQPLLLNSCTSAIDLALHLIGHQSDQEQYVISTPITCTATNSPAVTRGLNILWADVDPLTGNIDPASVAALIAKGYNVRAIIAVNWAGRRCDYKALVAACNNYAIPIIEDAAHGPFTMDDGKWGGDYVCWSFQAIKALTTGDGGALYCRNLDERRRAKLLRWYGLDRDSGQDFRCAQDITEIGYKYQSNDIAAAIGLANLPGTLAAVRASQDNAAYYCHWLRDLPGIAIPPFDPGCAYWLMTLCVDDRADFMAHLAERGIATSQVHARNDKHTAFKAASEARGPLPGVDAFDARQVSIPNGWWVSEQQREYIASTIANWAMGRARRAA